MIDLHSHILPGLDDGAASIIQSVKMAIIAARGGIRGMAVTPHCVADRKADIRMGLALLRDALQEAKVPLILYPGMEIMGSEDSARMLANGELLTINGSRYPLVEFDFKSDGEKETEILADIIGAGFVPIVAHPERYQYVRENPELVNIWKEMGCEFQINRGSLLGHFGEDARNIAYEITTRGFATLIASDAHSDQHRLPTLDDVKNLISRQISPMAAAYLLRQNPLRILRNDPLPKMEPNWF